VSEEPLYIPAEIEAPVRKPFPGLWQALALCGVFLGFQLSSSIGLGAIWAAASMIAGKEPSMDMPVALIGLSNVIAFVAVCLFAWLWSGDSLRSLFPFRRFRPALLLPMLVTVVGVHILLSEADNVLRSVWPIPDIVAEVLEEVVGAGWASVLAVVLIAPLTEEPMFRGIVFSGFRRRYSPWTAGVLSSALFALVHLNPWQFFGAFMLGLVFAWWMLHTRSLWPCMMGHGLANGLSVLLPMLPIQIPGYNAIYGEASFQPLWLDLTGFALAVVGIVWTQRLFASGAARAKEEGAPAS
jgi:membrane protease YdiL (CAAX protease family)